MVGTRDEQASELMRMRRRLDEFRRGTTPGKAFPGWVWSAAARLARRYGVHRTGRALGLEYNKLKRASGATTTAAGRVAARRSQASTAEAVKFLELARFAPPNGVGAGEAVVEMAGAGGARLAVRLKDSSPALLAVIEALRGQL